MKTIFTHLACIGEVAEKTIRLPDYISDSIQHLLHSCETENPGVHITFSNEVRMYVRIYSFIRYFLGCYGILLYTYFDIGIIPDYALELYSK